MKRQQDPDSLPPKRQAIYDMRFGNREPTPESESPSPCAQSPEPTEGTTMGDQKYDVKNSSEPVAKWPFPKTRKGQKRTDPFPNGLPHANRYGAIKPRPLPEESPIELKPAPVDASWRQTHEEWLVEQNKKVYEMSMEMERKQVAEREESEETPKTKKNRNIKNLKLKVRMEDVEDEMHETSSSHASHRS
ncbi:unnamed protein product [Caenorhabditis sp. 36 PRJEB53466]|nr:unnamed protein product [Caenorhabditis sp. 36 PRJEB53466]